MPNVNFNERATLISVGGALTKHYPTLAEAVEAHRELDKSAQLTSVIKTPSATYEGVEMRRLTLGKMMDGLGSEAGYLARSEGVDSRDTIALARKVLIEPRDATREELRKLAAAILAHKKYGK